MSGVESNDLLAHLAQHAGVTPVTRRIERPPVANWRLEHILENPESDFQNGTFFVVGEDVARALSRNEDSCDVLRWTTLALDAHSIVEKSEFRRGSRQGAALSPKIEVYRARRVAKLDRKMTFGVVKAGRFQERLVVHLDASIALEKPDRVIFRLVGRHAGYGKYQRIEEFFGSKGIIAAPEKNPMPEETSDQTECQLEGMIQLWPSVYYICMVSAQRESAPSAVPQQQPLARSMQQPYRGRNEDVWPQTSNPLNVQPRVPAVTSNPCALSSHIREPGTPGTPPNVGKGALTSQRSSDMGTSPANEGLHVPEDTEANKSATSYTSDDSWTDMMDLVTQPTQTTREEAVPTKLCHRDISRLLESVDVHDIVRALCKKFGWQVIQGAFMATEGRRGQSSEQPYGETMSRVRSLEQTSVPQEPSLTASEAAGVPPDLSALSKAEGSENVQRKDPMFGKQSVLPVKVIPRSRGQKEEMEVPGEFSIKALCQMVNKEIDKGKKPRIIALAHERTEGMVIERAFDAFSVPAKHFKGKLKETNYVVETRNYIVLVLNPHAVLNIGPEFLSTVTAVCEPKGITSSRELVKLREQCQELSKTQSIKWYKMLKET